jgi:hypothetical protein
MDMKISGLSANEQKTREDDPEKVREEDRKERNADKRRGKERKEKGRMRGKHRYKTFYLSLLFYLSLC